MAQVVTSKNTLLRMTAEFLSRLRSLAERAPAHEPAPPLPRVAPFTLAEAAELRGLVGPDTPART